MAAYADDLDATLAEAFRLLSRGVADRRSAFHTPSLATVGRDGLPELRTVVLRGFEPATRMLRFHTDRRAGKIAAIAANPSVAVHGYDAQAAIQLRLAGTATLHSDDAIADQAWAASLPASRTIYAVDPGPGSEIEAPAPAPADPAAGRAYFAVVLVRFNQLEFLSLHASGHRRSRYRWQGPVQTPQSAWLVP